MYEKLRVAVEKVLADEVIQKRSELEADIIADGMKRTGCSVYVDLGCWAGLLARDVLRRGTWDAILVDGVPEFVTMAEKLLNEEFGARAVEYLNAVLIPSRDYLDTMRIPMDDTSAASIMSSKGEWATLPKTVMTAGTFRAHQLFLLQNFNKRYYLKIDLEGVDIPFLKSLFRAGAKPSVVHFEVKDANLYDRFKPLLVQNGFYPPELERGWVSTGVDTETEAAPRKQHEFWSVACGPNFAYVLGINPDKVYGPFSREGVMDWLKTDEFLFPTRPAAR